MCLNRPKPQATALVSDVQREELLGTDPVDLGTPGEEYFRSHIQTAAQKRVEALFQKPRH
ncbi:MAG: hypothetical protein AAB964_01050 [Patescibacteria group bacterium]|mgnify:CR=1 FL=1